jgi:hypothetical protein
MVKLKLGLTAQNIYLRCSGRKRKESQGGRHPVTNIVIHSMYIDEHAVSLSITVAFAPSLNGVVFLKYFVWHASA